MSESKPRDRGGLVSHLDRLQRRHPSAGFPLAVVYKFFDDQGAYLSALITYYGFLSLFPLLLLLATALGYVLHSDPSLQHKLINSAFGQLPVIESQLRSDNKLSGGIKGSPAGLVFGILVALYGGLGVAQAGQNAMNKVWAVPRNERPNPFAGRGRSLVLLLVLGGGVVLTTAASSFVTASGKWLQVEFTGGLRIVPAVVLVAANVLLFLLAFRVLTIRDVSVRDVLPGVIGAAVGWEVLQVLGTYFIRHELRHASEFYGIFGVVLGLMAWIYLGAVVVVICAEVNVVRVEKLWPRALLTPFTDDVDLTGGDRRAYTSYSETERYKGYQQVDVQFGDPPRHDER